MKINVHCDYPPVPTREFDWSATLPDYEPGDPIGRGVSQWQAVADLMEQLEQLAEAA